MQYIYLTAPGGKEWRINIASLNWWKPADSTDGGSYVSVTGNTNPVHVTEKPEDIDVLVGQAGGRRIVDQSANYEQQAAKDIRELTRQG